MSRGNLRVRPATTSDINDLIALTVDNGVTEHVGRRGRKGDPNSLADRYRSLLSDLERLVLVAVDEASQQLVGFAVLVDRKSVV